MSAWTPLIGRRNSMRGRIAALLCSPYDTWSPARLLEHFQTRTGIDYFPIVDPDETRADRIEALLDDRFTFNGETHQLATPIDWLANPSADIEWHILLHKFYYAVGLGLRFEETEEERYIQKWMALTDSWISAVPPGFIAPDVTGRRVQNWIYANYYFVTRVRSRLLDQAFYCRFLISLHAQVEYLVDNLAPARNHRTIGLWSIFLASVVFPEFRAAERWQRFALTGLERNVADDLLADGVQCELSTDYHHLVLRNFLCVRRLAHLNDIRLSPATDRALQRALEFSMHVHNPRGEVPSFSDGDVRHFGSLLHEGAEHFDRPDLRYAATSGREGSVPAERTRVFPQSGYVTVRSGWGTTRPFRDEHHLVFDCGPLGAGNHGHLDLLSFELAANGERLVVDPARYTYNEAGDVNWRAMFRGTSAHNTVLVDGRDQAAYGPGPKGKWKVRGAGAQHELRSVVTGDDFDYLHGIARSTEYDAVHERRIFFVSPEYWIVSDVLTSATRHRYEVLFHLDAAAAGEVSLEACPDGGLVQVPGLALAACGPAGTEVSVDTGFVSRRYGHKVAAPVIRVTANATCAVFHTVLLPRRAGRTRVAVTPLAAAPLDVGLATRPAHAAAIRLDDGHQVRTDHWFFADSPPGQAWRVADRVVTGPFEFLRGGVAGTSRRLHAAAGRTITTG